MKITLEYDSTSKNENDWIPHSYVIYVDGRADCSFDRLEDAQRTFREAAQTLQKLQNKDIKQ